MKVSYNWLKDYIEFSYSPVELSEKLTMVGIEVEAIRQTVPEFDGIIVAKVLTVDDHPNADKLSVCKVDTGTGTYSVICGAPNVAAGQLVPFAPTGTRLPVGITIRKTKIRGIDSVGMICSEQELGMADHSDGIWILPDGWQIGADVQKKLAELQDYILELSITPNRPDAMSMIGIAREIAAIVNRPLKYPEISLNETAEKAADVISVDIDDIHGCPRYTARVIRGVTLGSSPAWMANRLRAAGMRPINNIVDITNYVLLEFGQPLHAFDMAEISDHKIIVRASKPGEVFTTLDDKQRGLPENTVMICDAEKTVAIGGIMGGQNSEVSETTVDILLESAYFTPMRISAASKRLGLSSEASQRFEKGVDPEAVVTASDRAAAMMAEFAGGKVLSGIVDAYPVKVPKRNIPVRVNRINHVLGTDLTEETVTDYLRRLQISFTDGIVTAPSFRPDIEREIDVIEEVARSMNFDNIPTKPLSMLPYDLPVNRDDRLLDILRANLRELGFYEVLTNSMIPQRDLDGIDDRQPVKILNPISDDLNVMRTSLFPGLLKVLSHNINRNMEDLRIFELGRVFEKIKSTDDISQVYKVAMLIHGARHAGTWDTEPLDIDFYDIKGIVEAFKAKIALDNLEFILYSNKVYFDREQTVELKLGREILGHFGRIDQAVCKRFDIDSDVFGCELDVPLLLTHLSGQRMYQQFSRFPYVEKDLAFVVNRDINADQLYQVIYETGRPLVNFIEAFDLYQGDRLPEDKKSLAFRIRFQSTERTLTDAEVNTVFQKIIRMVQKKLPATLRE